MIKDELKKVIRDEFSSESDKSTGESFTDKLCKAVVDKINRSDGLFKKET